MSDDTGSSFKGLRSRFADAICAGHPSRAGVAGRRVRAFWGLSTLLVIAMPALLSGCGREEVTEPDEGYLDIVSAFYTGVTAIHAGDNERALASFERTTQLAPEEPAGWANLALTHVRVGSTADALPAIAEARRLAPEDDSVAYLAAMVAGRAGEADEALDLLRRAVELNAENVRARYALVEELGRTGEATARPEAIGYLRDIVRLRPDNVLAAVELARFALEDGDLALVGQAVDGLALTSAAWPEDAREQLESVRAALSATEASGDAAGGAEASRTLSTRLLQLNNLLLDSAIYQRSFAELKSPQAAIAEPLEAFVELPAPDRLPAEPDVALRFDAGSIPGMPDAGRLQWVRTLRMQRDGWPVIVGGVDDSVSAAPLTIVTGDDGSTRAMVDDGATALPGVPPGGPSERGVLALDVDNDGIAELVLAGAGGASLLARSDSGAWRDASADAGWSDDVRSGEYSGAWAIDMELDGDLDVLLGVASGPPVLLRNPGQGEWRAESVLPDLDGLRDAVWADLDGDVDPDLSVLDSSGNLTIFDNERSDRYVAMDRAEGVGRGVALAVADSDHDGRLDLTVLEADGRVLRVAHPADVPDSRAESGGAEAVWRVEEIAALEPGELGFGPAPRLLWADLDNNGAADLVVGDGLASSTVWLAGREGALTRMSEPIGLAAASATDLDSDGRIDIVGLAGDGTPGAAANRGGERGYRWLAVQPIAQRQGDQRNNAFGVGGEMEARSGLLVQKRPMDGPVIHFGLGENQRADYVRIRWPNGSTQGEFELATDAVVQAEQRLKGSCPWLFAWNGEEMAFVTDVLWRSPLGLRINAQVTAGVMQTRDRVVVRGEQLAPREGSLDLRITAELWETHFFDEVSLTVIDHPAGTNVFIDERFSVPPPPLEPVVTGPTVPIERATDDGGRDVTADVRQRDGVYIGPDERGAYQGVAADHGVVLELPSELPGIENAPPGSRRFLVASGWIYPTDSSINIALSQTDLPPPSSLRLEVEDADSPSGWRVAREGLGFPAGKHKTVLLDLTDLWLPARQGQQAAPRLRLASNMEIYWDALAVALERPDVEIVTTTLRPDAADLLARGFSYTSHMPPPGATPAPHDVPEVPYYDRLASNVALWPDLRGFYTRFGDVRPLLERTDDRYAILNAGDELRLAFPAPEPPGQDLVRSYIFESDGWVKDGDFNTAYSATVHPLPSHDRPEYADQAVYGGLGPLQDDRVYLEHADDWTTYHTRWVDGREWGDALWRARRSVE